MPDSTSRFAPSSTGPAHPGTLLAALLAWLDARAGNGHLLVRIEDLDTTRSREEWVDQMLADLTWLGLEWDGLQKQSERVPLYEDALDTLAKGGHLYPCTCSRSQIRTHGLRAPDGGWRYPNTCRGTPLPAGGWRESTLPLRIALPNESVTIQDESGSQWNQNPTAEQGDPIAKRRDGVVAYNLASVVDDGEAGVNRIVRGRDLAFSTPTQWQIQTLLGYPNPVYRHHLLFLEEKDQKLAKLHGSVGARELREHYSAEELCGFIAWAAGILPASTPVTPIDLLSQFSWKQVASRDVLIHWNGSRLSNRGYSAVEEFPSA